MTKEQEYQDHIDRLYKILVKAQKFITHRIDSDIAGHETVTLNHGEILEFLDITSGKNE
jgi:hypothetical protein